MVQLGHPKGHWHQENMERPLTQTQVIPNETEKKCKVGVRYTKEGCSRVEVSLLVGITQK